MTKSTSRLLVGILLLSSVLPRHAAATQIIPMTPEQMGAGSALVVTGSVVDVRSFWNDRGTKIFTEAVIEVDESFKGKASPRLRVLQLGGTVDDVRVTVHGALQWQPGEEVLLFLEPYEPGTYAVSGFSQGKFLVDRDPASGARFIRRPGLAGVEFVGGPTDASKAPVSHIPLQQFLDQALGRR